MSEEQQESKRGIHWSPEKVMSLSALMVSVISVVALFYQLNLAREENRLIRKQQSASVLPYLTLAFATSPEEFKITIVNKGVGPAFIKEVAFGIEGETPFDRSDFLFNEIGKLIREGEGSSVGQSTYSFQKGEVIPANQEIDIIRTSGEEATAVFLKYFNQVDWEYEVIYEDVYGESWRISFESNSPESLGIKD